MVTSKCEAEIELFLPATPKKREKKRARGSMSETEKQVGRQKESLEKQIFFLVSK